MAIACSSQRLEPREPLRDMFVAEPGTPSSRGRPSSSCAWSWGSRSAPTTSIASRTEIDPHHDCAWTPSASP
jgi:hypothetical protein